MRKRFLGLVALGALAPFVVSYLNPSRPELLHGTPAVAAEQDQPTGTPTGPEHPTRAELEERIRNYEEARKYETLRQTGTYLLAVSQDNPLKVRLAHSIDGWGYSAPDFKMGIEAMLWGAYNGVFKIDIQPITKGRTLSEIALTNNTNVGALMWTTNALERADLATGRHRVERIYHENKISERAAVVVPRYTHEQGELYTVKPGDTLLKVTLAYLNGKGVRYSLEYEACDFLPAIRLAHLMRHGKLLPGMDEALTPGSKLILPTYDVRYRNIFHLEERKKAG